MDIDPPHESKGSTTGQEESDLYPVLENASGLGFPYAPEDFPNPGDKWGWKAGRRVTVSGHFIDRYLYLPTRLHREYKAGGFASKASVERFVMKAFPGADINAFFASFSWKIPSGKIKLNREPASAHSSCSSQLDAAECKARNRNCISLLETSDRESSSGMMAACDICCIEPGFCRDCCCILCSGTVDTANANIHSFIRCEAIVEEGFVCGHIAHIECGLRSFMAGTVGGSIALDAEYYCRRCDVTTDLVTHVGNLFQSCQFIRSRDEIEKILNICVLALRGSSKTSAKVLLDRVLSAIAQLKDGVSHLHIWKKEDTSTAIDGELDQCETDTLGVSSFKEPVQCETALAHMSNPNFDYRIESLELEHRIEQTLLALKKSQEAEYRLAEDILITQKNYLQNLYVELDKEKGYLAKCSPSEDQSLVDAVFRRIDQIRRELAKLAAMEAVAKGFGKSSKQILKEHFGVQIEE